MIKYIKNLINKIKTKEKPLVFNCPINTKTGDGEYVGRCYYKTYNNICPIHGNVEEAIDLYKRTKKLTKEI